jgi:hypothetical protein
LSLVTDAADMLISSLDAHRALLVDMTEMSGVMAKACYARFQATEDPEVRDKAIAAFDICGRNVRLSILAEVRLVTAASAAVFAAVDPWRASPPRQRAEADRDRDRYLDRERESDRERDGHPMTALGRAEALEKTLARNPDLDPDGRYTAQVIDIKARLKGETPPPPEPPNTPPDPPPAVRHAPANRAERRRMERRMRRASG